jgi:hypothetical protein
MLLSLLALVSPAKVHAGVLALHFFRFATLDPATSYAQCYWRVADVDALYQEVVSTGLRVNAPEDRPWCMREFALGDPSGTLIRIGQSTSSTRSADHDQ